MVSYKKWDTFADYSSEEDEEGEHEVVAQGSERNAETDFEQARRVQELDEEVMTDTAQLAMLRKQRKDVTEVIRAQSASPLPSSQWMLIGGSSFAKVPSKQVTDTLNKEHAKLHQAIEDLQQSLQRKQIEQKRLRRATPRGAR